MTPEKRQRKRMTVLAVFLFFVLVLLVGGYFLLKPDPTCFDGKRNQGEIEVDCGGPCMACAERFDPEPIVVRKGEYAPSGTDGSVDLYAEIYNPNDTLGAPVLPFTFEVLDESGSVIGTSSGKSFILPQESKSILAPNISISGKPSSVRVVFGSISWERFSGYQEKPSLSITKKRFNKVSSGPFFVEVMGDLTNGSAYDFRTVTVKVMLRDVSGKLLAVNQTEMNALLSKETREFRLVFPKAFPGWIDHVDVEPDADIYHEQNFIERVRDPGKFQDLQ